MAELVRRSLVDDEISLTVETWLGPPLEILVILVAALVLRWLLHRVVDRVVRSAADRHADRASAVPGRAGRLLADASGLASTRYLQRTQTMGAVLRSVITITIATIAILTVMAVLGIPLAPLLASAGIGGVALGLGAQSLVKDFLSGIFMIVEDQYGVGDIIDTGTPTGTVSGTVEDVSLRVTRIRDGGGIIWYVRNGEIARVGNRSQGWSTATVDIPIAYTVDVQRATEVIRSAIDALEQEPEWSERVLDVPSVQGVESLSYGVAVLQITARCAPNEHYAVQREIRTRVKAAFDREGIDMAATQSGPGPAGGEQR